MLIVLSFMQASDYRDNKIHTGWLDTRIAMRLRAERPPWYISVVGGALYVCTSLFNVLLFNSECRAHSFALV